jgi:hypothetical protein
MEGLRDRDDDEEEGDLRNDEEEEEAEILRQETSSCMLSMFKTPSAFELSWLSFILSTKCLLTVIVVGVERPLGVFKLAFLASGVNAGPEV